MLINLLLAINQLIVYTNSHLAEHFAIYVILFVVHDFLDSNSLSILALPSCALIDSSLAEHSRHLTEQ